MIKLLLFLTPSTRMSFAEIDFRPAHVPRVGEFMDFAGYPEFSDARLTTFRVTQVVHRVVGGNYQIDISALQQELEYEAEVP